jgi:hypothetical protein
MLRRNVAAIKLRVPQLVPKSNAGELQIMVCLPAQRITVGPTYVIKVTALLTT